MPWIRLDAQFPDHPKIVEAGPLAAWLYVCGIGYCNRLMTDGIIPSGQINKLIDVSRVDELVACLVAVGLWEEAEGGYRITDAIRWSSAPDPATQDERNTAEYRQWRREVLTRDGFQCRRCGAVDDLHAHHILGFAQYPSFRTEVTNGETLCGHCHRLAHNAGRVQ